MRPAYRFGLWFGLGAALVVGVVLAVGSVRPATDVAPRAAMPAEQLRPEGLPPASEPIVGDLTDEELAEQLDKLETFETRRYGATEASRRRRLRERTLRAKLR